MQTPLDLPPPSAAALAHSDRVAACIRSRLGAAGGWIDFADYMDLALYAPGLGYYSAGARKFGAAGDFVTAPEISALFARCLARALARQLRSDPESVILEIGAGSGALAAELLGALAELGASPARYLILEVSADLRERQRSRLGGAAAGPVPVEWLDELPREPLRGIILANEVADALPVSRFTIRSGEPRALGVVAAGDGFAWAARPARGPLAAALAELEGHGLLALAEGYTSEVSTRLGAWLRSLAASLGEGFLLLCDYGMSRREFYHPQRVDGTLACHYRHRFHHDPFRYPGLQDITAWVNFTAVAEAATAAGLALAGYTTQAHFLLDAGLDLELAAAGRQGAGASARLARQARQLLLPGEMGERFKVMALARGAAAVSGFGRGSLRHTL